MTSRERINRWFRDGLEHRSRYMIVVCDTFDHDDYPVYVAPGEDVWKKYEQYNGQNMQRVMEVYDLRESWESQMGAQRVFRLPQSEIHARTERVIAKLRELGLDRVPDQSTGDT